MSNLPDPQPASPSTQLPTPPQHQASGVDGVTSLSPLDVLKRRQGQEDIAAAPAPLQPLAPLAPLASLAPAPTIEVEGSSVNPTPVSAAPSIPPVIPDRSELLKQAAEIPGSSFIMPSLDQKEEKDKVIAAQAQSWRAQMSTTPAPAAQPAGQTLAVPAAPAPAAAVAPKGTPVGQSWKKGEEIIKMTDEEVLAATARQQASESRRAAQGAQPLAAPGGSFQAASFVPQQRDPGSSHSMGLNAPSVSMNLTEFGKPTGRSGGGGTMRFNPGIVAILGLLVAIGLFGTSLYVLASSGIRVPLVYKLVSGLRPGGLDAAQDSLAVVRAHTSYYQTGSSVISHSGQADPVVDPSAVTTPSLQFKNVQSESTQPISLWYNLRDGTYTGKMAVSVDSATAIPVYYQSGQTAAGSWVVHLPASTTLPLASAVQTDVKATLLQAVLRPIPLDVILGAATSEKDYQRSLVQGVAAAHYQYVLDASKLGAYLPDGATLDTAVGEASYAWSTGLPLFALVDATLHYANTTYRLHEEWQFSNWNASLATTDSPELQRITNVDSAKEATVVSAAQLADQIGIHVVGASSTPVVAITSTGEGITALLKPITTLPPLPITPTTADAKQRDVQRKANMTDLQSALEGYKKKQGTYPISTAFVQTRASQLLLDALVPTYLTKLPMDPLNDTYWYEFKSDGTTYTMRSIAEDQADVQSKKGKFYRYFEFVSPTK